MHSPVIDEAAHLPAGISHWRFARFDLYQVNPPLVRMVAALPILASDANTPWHNYNDETGRRAEFPVGIDLIRDNGMRSFDLFTWARWACIPFSLIGAWAVYCWSRQLFGDLAGLAALTMWCISPNILAHGQMITPDAGAASLGVLCCWRFWCWIPKPTWKNTLWFGLSLGFVGLTKFTWVILLPLLLVMWCVQSLGRPESVSRSAVPSAKMNAAPAAAGRTLKQARNLGSVLRGTVGGPSTIAAGGTRMTECFNHWANSNS